MKRVALFAAGLAGAFAAAYLAGSALDVDERTVAAAEHGEHAEAAPAGLAIEEDGYRLVQDRDALTAGRAEPYVFRILGPDGEDVRDYDVEHEKRLHLIVVRRPLDRFLHVHPEQRPDGAWTVPLELPEAGSYRVFADFTTGGERRTLAIDLQAQGSAAPTPEPRTDYEVIGRHGHGDEYEFTVRRAGEPVELQPYLGALGHLVVLREGDLAYLHAHAEENRLAFEVPYPSSGRYRFFLQFKVGGRVETASFQVPR